MAPTFFDVLSYFFMIFPSYLFTLTFFGFFKAATATFLGDRTPEEEGFLTLNPLVHVDLINLLIRVAILLLLSAALPGEITIPVIIMVLMFTNIREPIVVPINPDNFKNQKRSMALTILAGPFGCFAFSFVVMLIARFFPFGMFAGHVAKAVQQLLQMSIEFSVYFGVLHLVPISPLEGGQVLSLAFDGEGTVIEFLDQYGYFILIFLFFFPVVSSYFMTTLYVVSLSIKMVLAKIAFFGAM